MAPKQFVSYVVGFALLAVLAGFSVNYIVDPYSVFGTKFFPEYGQLQERYLKVEYLKKHSDFNTFLIGSSRVGVVKTEYVDQYFPGSKTYNLTISQANQWDVEKHVEWLVKNIPSLSHVIVQIDWVNSYGPDRPNYALLDEIHPDISGRAEYAFLLDYLTKFSIEGLKAKISNNFGGLDLLNYDMSKGYWSRPLRDEKIDANCASYIANEKEFHGNNSSEKVRRTILADALGSIARYKSLLDEKHIELTVLLTPQNHNAIDSIDIEDYLYFISQLVDITGFYNFMYYTKMTKNDCNYYETSHYRPVIGEAVIRTLAKQPRNQGDVYQYVTKATLDRHSVFLKANFLSQRAN